MSYLTFWPFSLNKDVSYLTFWSFSLNKNVPYLTFNSFVNKVLIFIDQTRFNVSLQS